VREGLTSVHFAARAARDAQLEKACVDRPVAEDSVKLAPIAWPISLRPPFSTPGGRRRQTEKLTPQPQEATALGFFTLNI
jgi:hypothetical protein